MLFACRAVPNSLRLGFLNGLLMDWLLLLFSNNFSTRRLLVVVLLGVIWGALSAKFSLWVTVPGMVVTAVVVWVLPIKKKDRAKQ